MNKIIILAAFILGMSHTVDAQLRTNSNTTTTVVSEDDKQSLTSLKSLLAALDTKEAWIRSNPEELKIANEQGWFTKAEATRKDVLAKIALIENKTK
jgi:predicted metal-dependent hydrolase